MKQLIRNMFFVFAAVMMFCILPSARVHAANESGWAGDVWWFHADKSGNLTIGWNTDPKKDMADFEDADEAPWAKKSWFKDIRKITVKNNVRSIGNYAFANSNVEEIAFDDESICTEIGAHAFENCTSLKTINFGQKPTLTWINEYAFSECDALKSITFPSTLKKLSKGAFEVSGLESVTIPRYCTSLGRDVFRHCPNLKKISVNSKNKSLSSKSGVLFNKKKSKLIQYPAARKGTTYTVPSSVTTITDYAFSGSEGLAIYPKVKTLKMSKKIKTIEENAFDYTDIKKIYFPRNRPTIKGGSMFDSDMTVKIYYKKARWPKKYRKKYGAKKVTWKRY